MCIYYLLKPADGIWLIGLIMDKIVELVSYLKLMRSEIHQLKKQMYDDYHNGKYDESKREYWTLWNELTGKQDFIKDIKKYITYLENKEKYSVIQTIDNK